MMDEIGWGRHINSLSRVYGQGPCECGTRRSAGDCSIFLKAGCMIVANILVQDLSCGDTFGDP